MILNHEKLIITTQQAIDKIDFDIRELQKDELFNVHRYSEFIGQRKAFYLIQSYITDCMEESEYCRNDVEITKEAAIHFGIDYCKPFEDVSSLEPINTQISMGIINPNDYKVEYQGELIQPFKEFMQRNVNSINSDDDAIIFVSIDKKTAEKLIDEKDLFTKICDLINEERSKYGRD